MLPGDVPVLVHVVSERVQVLRLRRTDQSTRISVDCRIAFLHRNRVGILIHRFFEAQSPDPLIPLSTLQATPRDAACKTRGQDGFATFLSCRALSSPTNMPVYPGAL